MLIGIPYIQYVSFNGVEIKRHAAYASNYFADLSASEILSVEFDLLDKISYDNVIDTFSSANSRTCLQCNLLEILIMSVVCFTPF